MALAILLLALVAMLPLSALVAQSAPVSVTVAEGEVSDMVIKGHSLQVVYRNTGTTDTEIIGEVQVRGSDDSLVVSVPLVEGKRIGAGRRETFRVPMPVLPPGKYTIYAVVDFGGTSLTAAQAALEIKP